MAVRWLYGRPISRRLTLYFPVILQKCRLKLSHVA